MTRSDHQRQEGDGVALTPERETTSDEPPSKRAQRTVPTATNTDDDLTAEKPKPRPKIIFTLKEGDDAVVIDVDSHDKRAILAACVGEQFTMAVERVRDDDRGFKRFELVDLEIG